MVDYAKVPNFGWETLFDSRYDLVEDHLPVKLALQVLGANVTFSIVMHQELALITNTFNL